jgi:hypothetical protein
MKNNFRNILILLLIPVFGLLTPASSQEIPHPVANTGIYQFLDELANDQIISLSSVIKPYSRLFIARCLRDAHEKRDQLSPRQQRELDFYFRDFGKEDSSMNKLFRSSFSSDTENTGSGREDVFSRLIKVIRGNKRWDLFYYSDSLFSVTVNPIIGGELFTNSAGTATYWRNGIEARAYIGQWGFYASLRDNHEKPLLGTSSFLTSREGGHLKGSTDWSEMQAGITYSWKWGNAGFVKDNIEWGNNYNGANIFGGRNPSFIQLRLQLRPVKWFTFNYLHGWLNSMVVDSANSYWMTNSYGTNYREVYHRKFLTANMFTITPFKYLNISAGNSIVYNNTSLSPAYLMPLFFYKSVDHSVSSGIDNMNSQMFLDISSRQIKHLHLYATLFVDELAVKRIRKKDEWNFLSWKTGFKLNNFPFSNIYFITEFTYSYPLTFQHYVPTTTFESNAYNLGHYLKDNSREWFMAAGCQPVSNLDIQLYFSDAVRGPDYTELATPRVGNPPLESAEWQNKTTGLRVSWQPVNDLYAWTSMAYSNISGDKRWSPEYFYGKKLTASFGITFGF